MGSSVEMIAPRRDCEGVLRKRGDRGGVVGGEWIGDPSVLPRLNIPVRAGAEPPVCAVSTLLVLLRLCVTSLLLRPFPCPSSCGNAGSCGSAILVWRRGPRLAGSSGCR